MQLFNGQPSAIEDVLYDECGISMDTTRLLMRVAMHLGNVSTQYSGESITITRNPPRNGSNRFNLSIESPGRA